MKIHRFLGIGLLLLVGAAFGQEPGDDGKLLDGTWVPTAAELGGNAFDEKTLQAMKLVVAGAKYTVTVGESVDRGSVKIDPAKKPKIMDINSDEGVNKGKTFLAIYEINGDMLRVCYDLTGKARPTEFKTKQGELHFLATYKRVK